MSARTRMVLIGVAAALVGAATAVGQDVTARQRPETAPTQQEAKTVVTASLLGEASFSADLDDSPGDVAVYRAGVGVDISSVLSERVRLAVAIEGEASWYDFSNATGLVPGTSKPFEDVYSVGVSPRLIVIESQQWSWFVGALVRASGESGADVGDTITGGGYGGVRYAFSDALAISAGVSAYTRLEDNAIVLPLLGIEWAITDKVRLTSQGPGLRLVADVTDQVSVYLKGAYESREFRLEDDSPLPGGVARDWRVPLSVGVAYSPTKQFSADVGVGVVAWQEYSMLDRNGIEVSDMNTDPAMFVSAKVEFKF